MKKLVIAALCCGIFALVPTNTTQAADNESAAAVNAVQIEEDIEMQQLRGYGPPPPPPPPPGRYGPPRPGYHQPPPPPRGHRPPPPPPPRHR